MLETFRLLAFGYRGFFPFSCRSRGERATYVNGVARPQSLIHVSRGLQQIVSPTTVRYQPARSLEIEGTPTARLGRKRGALPPQKPLSLIRDGEVGGSGIFVS